MIYLEKLTNMVDGWYKALQIWWLRQRMNAYYRKLQFKDRCIDQELMLHDRMLNELHVEVNQVKGSIEATKAALSAQHDHAKKAVQP